MQKQSLNGAWQFRKAGDDEWLPASVPGGVHTDLMALERIPDPFVADNELKVKWVAESDWEYQRIFSVEKAMLEQQRLELICDGLDTLAKVYLNGKLLGKAENMFCQQRWSVKELLKLGENEVAIEFASTVRYCEEAARRKTYRPITSALPGGPFVRKAPCHFGWDWGPQLPAIGIWKDIYLEGSTSPRLGDIHLGQHHQDGRVVLEIDATLNIQTGDDLVLRVTVSNPDKKVIGVEQGFTGAEVTVIMPINKPQLWWPNGYGAQPLYQVQVELLEKGMVVDERNYQVGLRTIELRQVPDQWGRSFTFVVNGVPIFAKGGNWIPADSFPTRITRASLEHLIASTAAANQNMLRVWGGGYYESEDFYDLCDRYGILIWQDFMFACTIYPFNEESFVENVHQEVIQNVRRIRHHACLALWCGNNEMESGWNSWNWNTSENTELKAADMCFFYTTLPGWLKDLDPDTAYWPSSPSSHLPHEIPNSNATGDNHLWEVWHAMKPFSFFREQFPRFASEFGFQSLPARETIETYIQPKDRNMTSRIMEHHQRNPAGNCKIITYMTDHFQMPVGFGNLVYTTQVLQAEAMRTAVEHWRRNRERCSGTLYWQTNDCWPVASWASIDYAGRWKALHYASRRFFAPVLLSVEDNGDRVAISVTNDLPQSWMGEVRWSLETLDGKVLRSGSIEIQAAALANSVVKALDFSGQLGDDDRFNTVLVAELWQDQSLKTLVITPFVKSKHLELVEPVIEGQVERRKGMLEIQLKSASLARFVEVGLFGADVTFSDNYFDLPVGRVITVTCPIPEGWNLKKARESLYARSLFDSYQDIMEMDDEF